MCFEYFNFSIKRQYCPQRPPHVSGFISAQARTLNK
jgi:hypothetical protein